MSYKKLNQKLISFTQISKDFEIVKKDMESGWNITSLIKNGDYFVGIMEETSKDAKNDCDSIFLPPKKRIKFLAK